MGRDGNIMKNYFDYTIVKSYDKTIFAKTVELIMQNVKGIEKSEYDKDLYDENQIQYIKTANCEIRVGNSLMGNAVWVMSEVDLDDVLKEWKDKTFYESEDRILTSEEISRIVQEAEESATRYKALGKENGRKTNKRTSKYKSMIVR